MNAVLNARQEQLCATARRNFSDLKAVFCQLHAQALAGGINTQGLADRSIAIMRRVGVEVDVVGAVDHQIATGVYSDMTEHGWECNEWPSIFATVIDADVLVLLSPIWLGEKSSVCARVIERLFGSSHRLNDAGQRAYHGRVGGCLITATRMAPNTAP